MTNRENLIPLTILTGFLGAGKTTLLQSILTAKHGKKIAVIENEFANLDIDSNLVKEKSDLLVELFNGCVCCSINGDLNRSLLEIASRKDPIDQVVIETTGVANSSNLVESLLSDHLIRSFFRLDAVITMVDVKHFSLHEGKSQDFRDQIASADLLVLNKVDLAEEAETAKVESAVRLLNQAAEICRADREHPPLDRVFGRFEYENSTIRPERIFSAGRTDLPSLVTSLSLEIEGHLDQTKFMEWMNSFLSEFHERLYRTKGILSIAEIAKHVVMQGVHASFSVTLAEAEMLPPALSRIVFIGRDLPKERIFAGMRSALLPEAPSFSFAPAMALAPATGLKGLSASGDSRVRIV